MKTILFMIVVLSLCALAPGPACGGVCPTPEKTKPVATKPPPVITEPPEKTEPSVTEQVGTVEPPEKTEIPPGPPPTEPPHVIPTEDGATKQPPGKPEGNEPEPRAIRLPQSGYGPKPIDWGEILLPIFLIGLIAFTVLWAAEWVRKH